MMPATTRSRGSTGEATPGAPPLAASPGALPAVLLMILFQLAPMVWVLVGSVQTPMAGA